MTLLLELNSSCLGYVSKSCGHDCLQYCLFDLFLGNFAALISRLLKGPFCNPNNVIFMTEVSRCR